MPYKIEGTTNTNAELVILKEDDYSVEKTVNIDSSQAYSANALASGTKVIFAKKPDGEIVGYGDVLAIPGALYDRNVTSALSVNAVGTQYLSKTFSGAGSSSRKMIFSAWLKRGNISTTQWIYGALNTGTRDAIYLTAANDLYIYFNNGVNGEYISSSLFRDVTGWFNLVVAIDTTDSTAGDRIRVWLNGAEINDWSTETDPSLNYDFYLNQANAHGLLGRDDSAIRWDGYAAEIISLDGQTHADPPSLFGELVNGVWVPKGNLDGLSYGTNGFYLDFANSGSLGNDVSGNGNHFTPTNLSASDQVSDAPTNNFTTMNSLYPDLSARRTYAEGNLVIGHTAGAAVISTFGTPTIPTSGKWYWEGKQVGAGSYHSFGICDVADTDTVGQLGNSPNSLCYRGHDGYRRRNSSNSGYGDTFTDGDIIGLALDLDNGKIWWSKNGVWQASGDPVAGTNPGYSSVVGNFVPACNIYDVAPTWQYNFGNPSFTVASTNSDGNGQGSFEYAPPTGFLALCSANMDDPSVEDPTEGIHVGARVGVGKSVTRTGMIHSTTQAKFGTSSMFCDGSGDYLTVANSADFQFGSGDWTLECWIRLTDASGSSQLGTFGNTGTQRGWYCSIITGSNILNFSYSTTGSDWNNIQRTWTPSAGVWYHVCVERYNDNVYMYIDGTQLGAAEDVSGVTLHASTGSMRVFEWAGGGENLDGWADDFRLTKGKAQYSGTSFTAPTRINSRDSYTKLLVQSVDMPNGNTTFNDTGFISDVNFDPSAGSLVFTKRRDGAQSWAVVDTERSVENSLWFNLSNAEIEYYDRHNEFMTDGVRLGDHADVNSTGSSYLDVVLRRGTNYGLDIVTYTGNGGTSNSVNHSLGAVPTMMWAKSRDAARSWIVYHSLCNSAPETYYGVLNTTAAFTNINNMWDNTLPTSTQFFLNHYEINSAENCIAYLFTDIPGFCKAFSYSGNGAAAGPYIDLGFRPALFLVKSVGAQEWWLFNSVTQTYNSLDYKLSIDTNAAEWSGGDMLDITSQGFKIRDTWNALNSTGVVHVGFAWAEQPGKWSNAR